jgi:methylmalonyl-CoA/ethylmalonyl-CoA epimerase
MNLADAKVAQLLIPVDDFEAGIAFYRDTLGIPLMFSAPPQMAFFDCGGVRLLVGVVPAGQKAQRGSAIYFRVVDIHVVHSALSSKGVDFPKSSLMSCIAPPKGNSGSPSSSIHMGTSSG